MPKAQHTPGPWMQDEGRPYDILFDDRNGDDVTPIVASVHTDNTDDEQWQADARLIAAAPGMLAVLKNLEASMSAIMKSDDRRAGPAALIPEWLHEVRAAIAKAEPR